MTGRTAPAALTSKGRATRLRIIETAAQLILATGATRTTLDDVMAEARVGKSQVYHYFSGKSELLEAVIEHQTARILGSEGLHRNLDSWGAWDRWRDAVVALQARLGCIGGCPLGSLAGELADVDDLARQGLARGFVRWEAVFRDGIVTMRDGGRLRPDIDAESVAASILASLQGGLLLCTAQKSTRPLEAALDGALTLLRHFATSPEQSRPPAAELSPT